MTIGVVGLRIRALRKNTRRMRTRLVAVIVAFLVASCGEAETPPEAGFYYELAEAYWQQGEDEEALPWYRAAIARDGGHLAARRNYAFALA